jgi:hypothetical protein
MPPGRAARVIDTMGIVVHRTTWRNYIGRPLSDIPVVDVFGMKLPLCIVRLSDIAVHSGEYEPPDSAEVIAACGYPSRNKAMQTGTSIEFVGESPDQKNPPKYVPPFPPS